MIEAFSLGMDDKAPTLTTQETAHQKLVYITNLEKDSQHYGIELNKEECPMDEKPQVKDRPFERPYLINLNHDTKVNKEYGSENNNAEEIEREKNMKKTKEITYTKISSYNSGEQPELQKSKQTKIDHKNPINK